MSKKTKGMTPVLITTRHRGVFFGFTDLGSVEKKGATLYECRNCLSWSSSVNGFLGLAKTGPSSQCKIGAEVSEVKLFDITSVAIVSDEAVKAWKAA